MAQISANSYQNPIQKVDPFDRSPQAKAQRKANRLAAFKRRSEEKARVEAPYVELGFVLRAQFIQTAQEIVSGKLRGNRAFRFGQHFAKINWGPLDAAKSASRRNSEDVAAYENWTACFVTLVGIKFLHPATILAMDPFQEVDISASFQGSVDGDDITFFVSRSNEVWEGVSRRDPARAVALELTRLAEINEFAAALRGERKVESPTQSERNEFGQKLNMKGEVRDDSIWTTEQWNEYFGECDKADAAKGAK